MRMAKKGIKLLGVSILLLLLLIIPASLFGVESDEKSEAKSKSKADFVLMIKEDLISLNANDASLKEIVEEIGRRMKIEVVADISEDEKITIHFVKLSIEDAIKKLSTNYIYVADLEKTKGKITKMIVLLKGKGTAVSMVEEEKGLVKSKSSVGKEAEGEKSPRPEPFKFEFDPSEVVKEGR